MPQREVRNWCSDKFLSYQTLNDIASNRTQYLTSLREIGFIPHRIDANQNRNNDNIALIRALCAGAFNPQLARIDFPDKKFAQSISGAVELDPEARTIKYFNQDNGRVFVHPSSTLFDAQNFPGNAAYMSYFNKMATSKVFIRDLTRLSPFSPNLAMITNANWLISESFQSLHSLIILWPNHTRYTRSGPGRRRLAQTSRLG